MDHNEIVQLIEEARNSYQLRIIRISIKEHVKRLGFSEQLDIKAMIDYRLKHGFELRFNQPEK